MTSDIISIVFHIASHSKTPRNSDMMVERTSFRHIALLPDMWRALAPGFEEENAGAQYQWS
jgi:hypothetical protein